MLCLKPYVLWKEHQKIKGQGYQGVGSGSGEDEPRLSTTREMTDEEDGNGHAVAEAEEDEHVSRVWGEERCRYRYPYQ